MKKKTTPVMALLVSAVFAFGAASVVVPAHAADGKPTNSKVAAKPLKAAKDALDAKKYQEAISKLKAVQALQGKNAYDDYLINEMLSYAYVRTKQYSDAATVLETLLDSQYVPRSQIPTRSRQLMQIYYQLKNYNKVIALGERAAKGDYADDEMLKWIGQAYYLKGDYKGAAKFAEGYVNDLVRRGKRPNENTLLLVQSSCDKIDDSPCLQKALERLVTYYPKTEYWQNLVGAMYRQQSGQTDEMLLQVYRLAAAVDVLKKPSDYTEFAQLALEAGTPGEATAILERGFEKKIFTEPRDVDRNKRLLETAKKQSAARQAALDQAAREAAAASTGDKDVSVGLAYLGYEQYDKAVEALNRGLQKSDLKNPGEARLLLGIAELRSGKKAEARKTFQKVKGNATLERLANLWALHAQA